MDLNLLKELSEAHGIPGHEEKVREIFVREVKSLGELVEDRLGSVAVHLKSSKKGGRRIFLGAHFDEVGFMVQNIRPDGFLQFNELGGWWGHAIVSQRVRILSHETGKEHIGIICSIPPHYLGVAAREKVLSVTEMFIDVGASSKEEVAKMGIAIGDPIVPDSSFMQMNKNLVLCKAFDNRIGVAITIEVAKKLAKEKLGAEVFIGNSVQEEMGFRGARTFAYSLDVEDAILLEGAPADDTPGLNPLDSQTRIGKGVQVRIMDSSAIMSRTLVDRALDVAKKKKIPTQVAVRRSGGTDAGGFTLTRSGTRCCVLSTPTRYIHTHNAILDLRDADYCRDLSAELLRDLAKSE